MKINEIFINNFNWVISEGGNVQVGSHLAQRIDLEKYSREGITNKIWNVLTQINDHYNKINGSPIWKERLLKNRNFLSGSSFHFFNPSIPHDQFKKIKPKVGDIDTQVDKNIKDSLVNFLQQSVNKKFGGAKLLGFNDQGNQLISLWGFNDPPIKVQVDFELVDYDNDEPTEWARFSHSSSWDDLESGIKGVFHKYLMRAFTTSTLKDRYIQKVRSIKFVRSTDLAFSVDYGMRQKYEPVLDSKGRILTHDDGSHGKLPVYKEIPVKDSIYANTMSEMFSLIFGKLPKGNEKNLLASFKGGVHLASKYLDDQKQQDLLNGFIHTLFGPAAQQLYRDDPQSDKEEKMIALSVLVNDLNLQSYYQSIKTKLDQMITDFYSKYKMQQSIVEAEDEVKASPRQGVVHLQNMKDVEFAELVKKIKNELKGKLDNVQMTLKVDGLGARFGKDKSGRPFFESSRSGPIFNPGSFSSYAEKKGLTGELLDRAKHYDELFNKIINSPFMKKMPNNTKVACEILYNPMAQSEGDALKFVTVKYDKNKLGNTMTIVPLYTEISSTGAPHPKSNDIKEMLLAHSTDDIKFIDNRLYVTGNFDVNAIIDPVASLDDNAIATLQSRKKVDIDDKNRIKELIKNVKNQLADFIINHKGVIGKHKLGTDIEGYIIYRDNLPPVKVTTPEFKNRIASK